MGRLLQGHQLQVGTRRLSWSQRPLIMGILNITPDSFSDEPILPTPRMAWKRAQEMVAAGADILDLGAESTRPGARPVSATEEKQRLLPVLKLVRKLPIVLSVDTQKPEVAAAALEQGAHILNDVGGLREPEMRKLAAKHQVPVVIMHMRGTPKTMQKNPRYRDVVREVKQELLAAARRAELDGIRPNRIILDPGIGFGKTCQHNLLLLQNLSSLLQTGYPILVGPSRKAFVSGVLGPMLPRERVWGTAAAVALAVAQGVHVVRVHDVREMKMVAQVARAIAQARGCPGRSN